MTTRSSPGLSLEIRSWTKDTPEVHTTKFPVQDLIGGKELSSTSELPDSEVSLIFASADEIRDCPQSKSILSERFKIPDVWWTTFARRSNGYFGYEDLINDRGERTGLPGSASSSNESPPTEPTTGSSSTPSPSSKPPPRTQTLLFYPSPRRDPAHFEAQIKFPIIDAIFSNINPAELSDPFWIYPRMIEQIVKVQDMAVWQTRDLVRDVEQRRNQFTPTLCVAETTLESINKYHQHFLNTAVTKNGDIASHPSQHLVSLNIRNRLSFQHHMFTSLRLRSSSNTSRIATEVTVIYNEVAYKDAKVLRIDSTAMRTVAFVTLIFLPATFVSAIFGTGFISYDAPTGMWGVSPKFWVFWAVAIPITLLTILGWFLWMRHFLRGSEDIEKGKNHLKTS
ncbi:Notoamide biosynthesis cluster protein M' [Cladobotryum mycophilum]|uniref:Notoamide biosynthesis cluster protein M n=1 Tax=Cladobotryum mycophilum TaxID=491253 RepID=A0ABR0T1W1_9HYPO